MGKGAEDCGTGACAEQQAVGPDVQVAQASEHQLTAADVYEFLQQNFDTLNTEKGDGLSGDELNEAARSGNYSGRDQEIVEFLESTRQYVARLSGDQPAYESEITMQDAQALNDGKFDLDAKGASSMSFEALMRKESLYPATAAVLLNGTALFSCRPEAAAVGSATGAYGLYAVGKGIKNYYDQKDLVKGLFTL